MSTPDNPILPSPPFYSIPNINNLRDAALFPLSTPHGPIRPGILFRSAEVSKLDLSGWQAVHSIGVAHVFDLRSKPEVDKGWAGIVGEKSGSGKHGDVRPGWIEAMERAGVNRTWAPVFEESDYSPEKLAERYVKYMDEGVQGFVEAYYDILQSGGKGFAVIFRYLAGLPAPGEEVDGEKLGALVHCTAGKDRTGIFFGILFDFLGVPREKIADEYNLTEHGLRHIREEVVGRLMQSPAFKNYIASQTTGQRLTPKQISELIANQKEGNGIGEEHGSKEVQEKGREAALRMVGARKESILKALEMVDKEFGGAEKYLREVCGLTDGEVEGLKRNLILKE